MADTDFNVTAGHPVSRELLLAFLDTGTGSPEKWSVLGTRVEDSSMEYDWQDESKKDILGATRTTAKKPIITQSFEPCELDEGDEAIKHIWEIAVKDQDAAALCNQKILVLHKYAGTADTAMFAERYDACLVKNTSLGGEGGGYVGMPIEVTFGGNRTIGTAAVDKSDGTVTFTPGGD